MNGVACVGMRRTKIVALHHKMVHSERDQLRVAVFGACVIVDASVNGAEG
ncbi:MAG: hypothetical protein HYS06_08930 [Methylocystis sp.]|nr:hypothetical protein [Methylocystis sp.]